MTREDVLERYQMLQDYHTHTVYSCGFGYKHGKGLIIENAEAAHRKGIREIAITDHGPGHKFYGLDMKRLPDMRTEIRKAMETFPDVKIDLGVEANFIDTPYGLDVRPDQFDEFDFVIAGYHYGLPRGHMLENQICSHGGLPSGSRERLRAANTDMVVRALNENNIRIITHPGDKGPFDIPVISRTCEETGTLMEINTRHKHLTVDEIRIAEKYDVSFVISSDAHRPEEVGNYPDGVLRALEAGLDIERIVNIKER